MFNWNNNNKRRLFLTDLFAAQPHKAGHNDVQWWVMIEENRNISEEFQDVSKQAYHIMKLI